MIMCTLYEMKRAREIGIILFFYELTPILTFQINSGNMPSVLSVIAIIAVVCADAFVFAFILVLSGGASRLASTEKKT